MRLDVVQQAAVAREPQCLDGDERKAAGDESDALVRTELAGDPVQLRSAQGVGGLRDRERLDRISR